jgi:hypothetical protein
MIFVPQGTVELCECFPASFQDARFCGRGFQPQCGWLISDAPSEQSIPILSSNCNCHRTKFGGISSIMAIEPDKEKGFKW